MPPRSARGGTGFATPTVVATYTVPEGFTWLVRELQLHNRGTGTGDVLVRVLGSGSSVPVPLFSANLPPGGFTRVDSLHTVWRSLDIVQVVATGANSSVRATWSGSYLYGVSTAAPPPP